MVLPVYHHGEVAYLSSAAIQVRSCSMDQLVLPSHYPIDYVCIALASIVRISALQKTYLPASGTGNDKSADAVPESYRFLSAEP